MFNQSKPVILLMLNKLLRCGGGVQKVNSAAELKHFKSTQDMFFSILYINVIMNYEIHNFM